MSRFLVVAIVAAALSGQTTSVRPSFEVATIKRNVSVDSGGGGGFSPGGRFRLVNVNVQTMILTAYRTGLQLFPSQLIGAPNWTSSDNYDITAKADDDLAEKPQAELFRAQPLLLQSLLEERFMLRVHRETRQLPIYALVLATKDGALGPQLRTSAVDCTVEPGRCSLRATPGHFTAGSTPISALVSFLAPTTQRVVVDRTGLEGRFEIALEWTPDRASSPLSADAAQSAADPPSIFTALQDQLGLKLESQSGPVDVIVIDHVERPTED